MRVPDFQVWLRWESLPRICMEDRCHGLDLRVSVIGVPRFISHTSYGGGFESRVIRILTLAVGEIYRTFSAMNRIGVMKPW